MSHDGWGPGSSVSPLSAPYQQGQITWPPPPSPRRLMQLMESSTMFDWLDGLSIDLCCHTLEIHPLGFCQPAFISCSKIRSKYQQLLNDFENGLFFLYLYVYFVCVCVLFFACTTHCHLGCDVNLTFLSRALLNQLPACSHKQQWGRCWMSSRLISDRFLKRCLVCADLHCFFFPIIFPPRPMPAAVGTGGRPGESLGGLTHCDCWLGHTIEKVGYETKKWVATGCSLINTVQSGFV